MSCMTNKNKFCLNLNGYEENVLRSWKELQHNNDFCDLTLACDGKTIETHRFVLSSSSKVFQSLFQQNTRQHPIIFLRGIRYKDLANILDFLYQGVINIPQNELKGFLAVAEDLEINGLSEDSKDEDKSVNFYTPLEKGTSKEDSGNERNDLKKAIVYNDNTQSEKVSEIGKNGEHIKSYPKQDIQIESEIPSELETVVKEEGIISKTEVFIKADIIDNHDEILHDGNQFICTLCQMSFPDSKSLRKHRKVVHLDSEFSCVKCEFKSTYSSSLKLHREAVHERISYNCEECTFRGTTKGNLIAHIRGKHERGQLFSCEKCKYNTYYKGELGRHVKSVHGGQRYPCNECDYKATRKTHLGSHEIKYHNQ